MRNVSICLGFLFALLASSLSAQTSVGGKTAVGRWKTIDDETGKPRSIVEFYQEGGKYKGKIVELFREPSEEQDPSCTKCSTSDARYNQKVRGMVIISDMADAGSKYSGGEILDPKKGSTYTATIWLESADVLKVRGWLGFIYRTQTWYRVQ
jgi:uncharacterized protein (DUF2147 family)